MTVTLPAATTPDYDDHAQAPYKVKLIRNTKGYQWEISVYGNTFEEVMQTVNQIDAELRQQYGAD